ncbi:hypothetical protein VRRI112168_01340 [Vreelandella rituensis]|uniref:Uncharacterized protein n=1 Tax=Vreelandella rituensis TaxID=2282306 RepID=A0A368U7B6_9GAMM|nr:hypothetical protein [Halomonas rituensis]RCV93059.1 hypothetical protein DU506_04830 [Halomonas rituensis]
MPHKNFDMLRALAIASQALGLTLIITLETVMRDTARPWQGVVLGAMVAAALLIALARLYRRNKQRKRWDQRVSDPDDEPRQS